MATFKMFADEDNQQGGRGFMENPEKHHEASVKGGEHSH